MGKGSRESINQLLLDMTKVCGDADTWYATHPNTLTDEASTTFGFTPDKVEELRYVATATTVSSGLAEKVMGKPGAMVSDAFGKAALGGALREQLHDAHNPAA